MESIEFVNENKYATFDTLWPDLMTWHLLKEIESTRVLQCETRVYETTNMNDNNEHEGEMELEMERETEIIAHYFFVIVFFYL